MCKDLPIVDSLWKLYAAKKITNIAAEIAKLKLDDVLELHVSLKSGYMNLTVHCYDNQPIAVFKALDKAKSVPALSLLKTQKRLHFETEGDPGDTVFAEYDADVPNYGLTASNLQSEDRYMKVIVAMTKAPNTANTLQKDHNDLLSYKTLEKSNKTPVIILRRKFIKFLHTEYDIPYPKIY